MQLAGWLALSRGQDEAAPHPTEMYSELQHPIQPNYLCVLPDFLLHASGQDEGVEAKSLKVLAERWCLFSVQICKGSVIGSMRGERCVSRAETSSISGCSSQESRIEGAMFHCSEGGAGFFWLHRGEYWGIVILR